MPDASLNPTSLVVVGIGSAFALSSVLYIAWDISGGHVNPAVTFAMAVGGHISVPTALFYWVAQLIASVMACLVLRVIVVGMVFIFLCVFMFMAWTCTFYLLSFFVSSSDSFDQEFFLFFCFISRARFMVSWDSGSRLVERLVMIYVSVWPAVWG